MINCKDKYKCMHHFWIGHLKFKEAYWRNHAAGVCVHVTKSQTETLFLMLKLKKHMDYYRTIAKL